ncbi:MAG: lamin tail domain-containing protein [Prolixibacteraceae bacterium]
MRQIFWISIFIFTLILSKNTFSQVIWQENFDVPDKGVWADSTGAIHTDFAEIAWTLGYEGCIFSDEKDYAKTVASTTYRRFEVVDSDGEVVWSSERIDISAYDGVNLSLDASETGNNALEENKYLKAYYRLNDGEEIPFSPVFEALGDWGTTLHLTQEKLAGESLQLVVRMKSTYTGDKVIIDNVEVTAIDSSNYKPTHLKVIQSPLFTFTEDTTLISAVALNVNNSAIVDSTFKLKFESAEIQIAQQWFSQGIYYWGVVVTDANGPLHYTISDEKGMLEKVDSSIVYFNRDDAELIADFEGSSHQGWEMNSDWEISSANPIAGDQSIKHALDNVAGTSMLSYVDNAFKLSEAEYLFSFKLKNGNWDPSASNRFYVMLNSNRETSKNVGYAVGVNVDGSSDLVALWKVKNGIPVELMAETQLEWNENMTAQIDVIRSAMGDWVINATDLLTGQTSSAIAFDQEFLLINEISLIFEYSATRAGLLWFDDLVVIGQNAAPFIANAEVIAEGTFQIFFNEAIKMDQFNIENIQLTSRDGLDYPIESMEKIDSTSVIIHAASASEPYLTVKVNLISDLDGETTIENSLVFENSLPATTFDVIINEIMADPTPRVGLPEAEYLELHNQSTHFVQLGQWTLFVRNTNFTLPTYLIAPGEYLIVCDDEFEPSMKNFGNVLGMSNFPALLNSGASVKISNADEDLIDEINYTDEWYFDNDKSNGGYSLERMDMNRHCGQRGNWTASTDPKGGTPGQPNSVIGVNEDISAPVFMFIDIVSSRQLMLFFDEPLDSITAQLISNYRIEDLGIKNIVYHPGKLNVEIELSEPIQLNTQYEFIVLQMADECGNYATELSLPFSMVALEAGQILINEVLYNPFTGGADFVEFYNNSGLNVDLSELKLATRDELLNLKSVYRLSELHAPFAPGEILAFTTDTLNIVQNYPVPFPDQLRQMSKFPAFNNEAGRVVLLNDSLMVLDEFVYTESLQSKWLSDMDGVSLERLSLEHETNDPANWQSASSLVGYATPGYKNSQSEIAPDQLLNIELESEVVSPNGDGYHDELVIKFRLDQLEYIANVYIFDAYGHEVKRLTNNDLLGNNMELVYDLRNANGQLLSMGAYVIFTELVHLELKKQVFKNAFLITDKM